MDFKEGIWAMISLLMSVPECLGELDFDPLMIGVDDKETVMVSGTFGRASGVLYLKNLENIEEEQKEWLTERKKTEELRNLLKVQSKIIVYPPLSFGFYGEIQPVQKKRSGKKAISPLH